LGGDWHKDAAMGLPGYIVGNLFSLDGLLGTGINAFDDSFNFAESGYGTIFGQLGLLGLFGVSFLFLSILVRAFTSRENKFFIITVYTSVLVLLFFSAYIFGYKTFGLIYLVLGFMMYRRPQSDEVKELKAV